MEQACTIRLCKPDVVSVGMPVLLLKATRPMGTVEEANREPRVAGKTLILPNSGGTPAHQWERGPFEACVDQLPGTCCGTCRVDSVVGEAQQRTRHPSAGRGRPTLSGGVLWQLRRSACFDRREREKLSTGRCSLGFAFGALTTIMARTKPIDDGRSSTAPVLPMVPSAKDSPTGQPRFGSLETSTSSGYCSSSSKHARDDTSAVASSTSTALGGRGVDAHRASVVWLASPAVSARLTCFAGLGGTRATWLRRVALEEAVGGDHLVHRDGLDLLVAVEP
eukprot:3029520-Prymnesium_polylepis.1